MKKLVSKKLMKTQWFPRPHDFKHNWAHSVESGADTTRGTIYPLCMYDEGLGTPSAYEANPEHASFVESNGPNIFPKSRVDNIFCQGTFSLTKGTLETDKLTALTFATMEIYTSFEEDLLAKDELSGLTTKAILELQSETTDRQCFPLWSGVDLAILDPGFNILNTDVPGLTVTQAIEGVAFSIDDYYDALHYYTNAGKIKTLQSGLRWHTLTRQRPFKKINFKLKSKTKASNPYNFYGIMVYLPDIAGIEQFGTAADSTALLSHLEVAFKTRYNEWNQDFNMKFV